jgi:hypothetical protein
MRFNLLSSSLFGTSTRARSNLSRLFLPPPPYLLLPLVFLRLDEFLMFSYIRCNSKPFQRLSVLGFIRLILASHIVPWIRYLGFTLKGRRVPWLRWRICPLAIQMNIDTHIDHQQAHFSGAIGREQVIKIRSIIAFLWIFLVFFWFFFYC